MRGRSSACCEHSSAYLKRFKVCFFSLQYKTLEFITRTIKTNTSERTHHIDVSVFILSKETRFCAVTGWLHLNICCYKCNSLHVRHTSLIPNSRDPRLVSMVWYPLVSIIIIISYTHMQNVTLYIPCKREIRPSFYRRMRKSFKLASLTRLFFHILLFIYT